MLKFETEEIEYGMQRPRILKATEEAIVEAAGIIRGGGLVIYPTETVYGLGCDPFNSSAVDRIIKVKGRENKPLPMIASSTEKAHRVAQFNAQAEKIVSDLWPGPLTLILKVRVTFPQGITLGLDTIGIRVPDHHVALRLAEISGGYLVSTSANKSGAPEPRRAEEAAAQIGQEVDLILDDGRSPLGHSSTILDLTAKPNILREGPIPLKLILEVLRS
jgi:L-threonylcarbamoyladenylate synthase